MRGLFAAFAEHVARVAGSAWTFLGAVLFIAFWALTGPLFGFSAAWQLVINTGTTIVTFLMVFLIQNAQNRGDLAIQIKLDEIIRALSEGRTELVGIERLSDEQLQKIDDALVRLGERRRLLRDPAVEKVRDVTAQAGAAAHRAGEAADEAARKADEVRTLATGGPESRNDDASKDTGAA